MLEATRRLSRARIVLAAGLAIVAVSCANQTVTGPGYLGMSLPADAGIFPDSVWTRPIPPSPAIDPDSAAMIATLKTALVDVLGRNPTLQVNATGWTAPLHVVDPNTSQRVDVPCDSLLPISLDPDQDGIAEGLPIPQGVWADPMDDAHMIIVDSVNRIAYEFWKWRETSQGHYAAGMMGTWDLAGPGWNAPGTDLYPARNGATASKTPYIGGLIRPEEVAGGEIRHALDMVVPTTRAVDFRSPAVRTDGRNSGNQFIPEGSRMQLDPSVDLDALGLAGISKIIGRALQVYGAYVTDTATGWNIKLQNLGADGGAWKQYQAQLDLDLIPIEDFRLLQ